jgi:hypothetical protein
MLEPYDGKLSRTVLRGEEGRKPLALPGAKMTMKEYNQKELRKRVSEVLYYLWDPIGVSLTPEARAEYEGYVLQVVGILEQSEGIQELTQLLSEIRTKNMGLPENMTKDLDTAQLLQHHKRAVIQGLA